MKGITHPSLNLFKKEKFLGRGGFGDVWKVLYYKGGNYLAMKELSKKEILKQNFVSNIYAERDILNYIYNIHIVNLYSTFQDENYLYMIMDYLEGGDLRKLMKQKIFNEEEIKFIAACIIIGLEYIHEKKIIHRDIKPENLIFDDKGYLRISDFGIAIRNDKINRREKNNDKSGTPGYMAPERIINDNNITYNYSIDFFSLGVILYELTTLKSPFRKNNENIGRIQYTSYENVIKDLFNNAPINLSPSQVKNFRNEKNDKNENININHKELFYLCDLINKLLIYDQEKRLGYDNIEDIKNHPFFGEKFEWKKIYHRSYISPFFSCDMNLNIKNENNKNYSSNKNISKTNKIENNENNIEKNKFENFTSIHIIKKKDFNYFYIKKELLGSILKFRNESTVKKNKENLNNSNKKNYSIISQKKVNLFNQIKKGNNLGIIISPRNLFKRISGDYKINNNKLLNNENINSKIKISHQISEDNFSKNKKLNKTSFNFYKKDSKINYFNKNIHLPVINNVKNDEFNFQKPSSANPFKKKLSKSIEYSKKLGQIMLGKNSFKENNINLMALENKKLIFKKEHLYTDSNLKIGKSLKTTRKMNEKSNLLKNNDIRIINYQYRDRTNESNYKGIRKNKIKKIFYIH